MTCLDTSFVIDYWRGEPHAATVIAEFGDNEPVWVPAIALFELYIGALLSDAPAETVESVASDLSWADPLPFGEGPAREAARIDAALTERGEQINLADVLIAGTARDAGMRLITADAHFERVPDLDVRLVTPNAQ
ncbi:PIN domain-containing protein [Halomarina pelagica]|uniref:PIN domain-containing protein n=1 Tax=Halomarina pelagica TaxID=2961599 RepID=UPI0020C3D324|nr:PIN domain-containing protein [Halomarina sp. BND7]